MTTQEKPGRNDPCYCGSGLKYKKCHLQADQEIARAERAYRQAAHYLRQDLLEFAQDERFAIPFGRALPLYWNGYYDLQTAEEMSENEALRFFDWFAFDYLPEGDGERVVDVYRREQWEDLSREQQQVLESWLRGAPAGAYTLRGYDGQTLHLEDFLTGERYDVYEPGGRGQVSVGDVILARLQPVLDRLELGPGAAYLPQDEIDDLREKLAAARAEDAIAHPEATEEAFMRRHNHLLIHHALEQAKLKGRPPVSRLEP
ncbi:MAG: SEC-C domain-containing protein [Chloroflexi bacterium]|nr:SEC-C domain-containing protein [Chloroflexota bacterium]